MHEKIINNIRKGIFSRAELLRIRANAEDKLKKGDETVKSVIEEIDYANPVDKKIVFMGFCPDADVENRLDVEWKKHGICTFDFFDSEAQLARFNDIWSGDLIILKKRQQFGKTMRLYGHGRVSGVKYDSENNRYLEVNWSPQEQVIEVPLMGCNSTVDVKTIEQVEAEMPSEFYLWLNHGQNI